MLSTLNKIAGTLVGAVAGLTIGIPTKLVENFAALFHEKQSVGSVIYGISVGLIFSPFIILRGLLAGIGEGLRIGVSEGFEHGISPKLINIPKKLFEFEMGVVATKWVYPIVCERANHLYEELKQNLHKDEVDFSEVFYQLKQLQHAVAKCNKIEENDQCSHQVLHADNKLKLDQLAVKEIKFNYFSILREQINTLFLEGNTAYKTQDVGRLDLVLKQVSQKLDLLSTVVYEDSDVTLHKPNAQVMHKFSQQLCQLKGNIKELAASGAKPVATSPGKILNSLKNANTIPTVEQKPESVALVTQKNAEEHGCMISLKTLLNDIVCFFSSSGAEVEDILDDIAEEVADVIDQSEHTIKSLFN